MGKRARKRDASKVRVGRVTKQKLLRKVPKKVQPRPDAEEVEWDRTASVARNYAAMGCAADPNGRGGRQRQVAAKQSQDTHMEAEQVSMETLERIREGKVDETAIDQELRVALGRPSPGRKTMPRKLTKTQWHVMKQLVDAHGNDIEAMAKDRKKNPMLHTVATLRKLVDSYHAYPSLQQDGGWRGFRAPVKSVG
eukprot:scaffold1800_cov332-Pavlova_lutheri.AAC.10